LIIQQKQIKKDDGGNLILLIHKQHFLLLSKDFHFPSSFEYWFEILYSFQYSLRTSKGLKLAANTQSASIDPSCTPSMVYRALGLRACLELNPFRSIQLGSRPTYPITVSHSINQKTNPEFLSSIDYG
jgi:hypothetical protein